MDKIEEQNFELENKFTNSLPFPVFKNKVRNQFLQDPMLKVSLKNLLNTILSIWSEVSWSNTAYLCKLHYRTYDPTLVLKSSHSTQHSSHSLICSDCSNQMSDCERFAQIAQDKWATVN